MISMAGKETGSAWERWPVASWGLWLRLGRRAFLGSAPVA
jgi:hypothetical protein